VDDDLEFDTRHQLFAVIKRTSKYFGQTEPGERFPVFISPKRGSDYPVQGGPGGQYRLADVQLWVVEDGKALRIA
jgi:hypothetical protein